MKIVSFRHLAMVLLAGSALSAVPALAQNDARTDAAGEFLQQGTPDTGASMKSDADAAAKAARPDTSGADASTNPAVAADSDTPAGQVPPSDEQSASELAPGQQQKSGEVDSAAEAAPGQRMKEGDVENASEAAPGQMKETERAESTSGDQKPENQVSQETTASIDISAEQKTEIRNVIVESKVEPANVDFQVDVGVSVPSTVTLHRLPPRVVEIVPVYEDYRYFVLADGRIVIVEPSTLEIVYILVV
jgi:hypothetical protein